MRLRGRDAELAVLGEAIGALALGQGGVLLIEGAAGSGKTSLLSEARRDGRAQPAFASTPTRVTQRRS